MNLETIKKDLEEYITKKDLKLFEINYSKADQTLGIILDEKLNMDELEDVSNDLSTYLDKYDKEFDDNYILDVSTVGVERPIRNEDELIQAINSYIYVKTKENEYNGTLKSYENGQMKLECMDKTRTKEVVVDYKQTKIVRYAVNFKGE